MPAGLSFKLRHASIVLVLPQPVDSQSVSAGSLARNRIVPEDWQVANEVNLAGVLAQTLYRNGVNVRAEGNRCIFQQTVNGEFRAEYDSHLTALNYAEASRVIAYQAIGINWMIELDLEQAGQWLTSKFAGNSAFVPSFQPVSIKVARQQGAAICNLTFNLEQDSVVLDCNYHVDLGGSRAVDVINMWQQYQKHLQEDILPTIVR